MSNIVYIATSLDGYIADKNHQLDWLHEAAPSGQSDFGFSEFLQRIDAIIMGRNTLETILGFGCEWPYQKPVFILSNTLTDVPSTLQGKVFLEKGKLQDIVGRLNKNGYNNLYIDGGITIQSFLKEDMIDEMIISTIPTLLGGGIHLFSDLKNPLKFKYLKSEIYLDTIVKNYYVRE
ncbi:dihydrofolate reductase [Acinetobacter oleivorans]|uniref:dihydrofolate reductase family protein n=1 Tax=Acinetobacter oleivorans TaxID=1148157 RepID=UPI00190298F7|nr:dihydrofolate reductase family protein [Acinetobacter oleivorans]MBJ9420009.1 dihydrofolate reductase [Acinetobacter oleivorans]MBJ9739857.1 dihydrofolate reductase [Acinetobacter oleivorans]MCU4409857.1 dihydrofolate reductase family protein [Acinetobacter oleivorans]